MMRQWWIISTMTEEPITVADIKLRVILVEEATEMPEEQAEHFNQLLILRDSQGRKENS